MVLALPTLNLPGIALAVVAAVVYIRRRRLPLLNTLDAISPCAALLAAFLYAGRMAEGTREGMLTSLPWAIPSSFGRVHPVEIYSSIASLLLCGVFLWILGHQRTAGEAAAWAMVLGGLLQFVMCFFRLPQVLYSDSLLDGSQVRALYLTVAGGLLLAWRVGFGAPIPLAAKDAGDAI
jgi:phosphatidylglycerol:prolipoprotein diacylglycerol transferase